MAPWQKSVSLKETEREEDVVKDADAEAFISDKVRRQGEKQFVARDGGWRGWMVCATAFWANGAVIGLHKTFGVLYVGLLDEHNDRNTDANVVVKAACIGSVTMGVLFASAVFTSAVASATGLRQSASLGVILACAGLISSSFVHVLEYYFITYSLLIGLGTSFIFTAQTTVLMHYFKRHLGIANGIAVLGGSVFSIFQPFVMGFCLKTKGLSTTLQIQGVLMSVCFLATITWKEQMSVSKQIDEEKRTICRVVAEKCPCTNASLVRNGKYVLFCFCVALAEFTQFVPFVHMLNHVKQRLISENGEVLLMVIAVSSGLSRLILGKISDTGYISKIRLYQLGALALGVGTTSIPFAHDMISLGSICCVIGAAEGAIVVMKIPVLAQLVDITRASQAVGMLITMSAIPQTLGPPLAGWLYNLTGTYRLSFYLAGTPALISACLPFLVPVMNKKS